MARELTEKEQKYVRARADGYPKSRCAEIAGYSTPHVAYAALERRESIKKAIMAAGISKIGAELLPKALKVFSDILDPASAAPSGVRVKAARFVTEKALELQAMQSAQDVANKSPLDMTEAELELFIMRGRVVLKRESAARELGIIDAEPVA